MSAERLDRLLAREGLGSRRECTKLIRSGRVSLNGAIVRSESQRVSASDSVCVDERDLIPVFDHYLMLNKKAGTVCTPRTDRHESVFDALDPALFRSQSGGRLHCVGHLDCDTEGLLILTTDGNLTHRIISPKSNIEKTYAVRLARPLDPEEQRLMREKIGGGIHIAREGNDPPHLCLPARLSFTAPDYCELILKEGRYHQVKRMIRACSNEVIALRRIAIASLSLDESLAPGSCRPLTDEELALLSPQEEAV